LAYAAATREVSDEERLATIRREQLIDATKEARKNIAEEKVELESLLRIARDKNASDKARAEAVKQLNELSPEYLGALTTENVLTEEGTKLVDKYVEALEKRALAEAMQTKLVELQKEKIDNQFKSIDELVGAQDLEKLSLMALIDADKAREERRKIAIENLNEQNKAIDEQISVLTNQLATSKEDELQTDANTRAYEANAAATKKAKTEKELLIEQMEKESLELEKLTISREEALNKYQELLAIETEATRTAATEEAAVEQERFDFLSAMGTAFVDGEIARIEEVREAAKRADEERQANLDKAQQGIEFLGLVNQAFVKDEEKREKIRKALALAQIAVDTARGISAAVAAGAGVPFPGNIPAIIAGVSAVLAGVIQAKQVIGSAGNTPSVDSAISGASAGGGGVPLNNISNTASLVDQQQQEITTQVVVLESDITTTQENVTTVSELSSF
jgi:hypothetical protein